MPSTTNKMQSLPPDTFITLRRLIVATIGLLVGAGSAGILLVQLPERVRYKGHIGVELWSQQPQRNEDIAFFVFVLVTAFTAFGLDFLLQRFGGNSAPTAVPKTDKTTPLHRFTLILSLLIGVLIVAAEAFGYRFFFLPTLDLFHLGEQVVPAMQLNQGAIPYQNTWFIHGFGVDAAPALVGQALGFPLLEGKVLVDSLLLALTWAVYLLVLVWLSSPLVGVALGAATWLSGLDLNLPRLLPLLLVIRFLGSAPDPQSLARRSFVAALIATPFSLWFSQDSGYTAIALFVGLAGFSLILAFVHSHRYLAVAGAAVAGLASGLILLLLLAWLWLGGEALQTALSTHAWILAAKSAHDAIPFNFQDKSFSLVLRILRQPILIAACAFAVLSMLRDARRPDADLRPLVTLVLLTLVATIWSKKMLDRSDPIHILVGNALFPALAAAFYQWLPMRRRIVPALATLALAVWLCAPKEGYADLAAYKVEPLTSARPDAFDEHLCQDFPWRSRISVPVPNNWCERFNPPLLALEAQLAPTDTFYDFTNAGLAYYILDRPAPIRFVQPLHLMNPTMQREAVEALKTVQPAAVLFKLSGYWGEEIDKLSNELRHPILSAWLLDHYTVARVVEGAVILSPKHSGDDSAFIASPPHDNLNMKWLAYAWGEKNPYGFDTAKFLNQVPVVNRPPRPFPMTAPHSWAGMILEIDSPSRDEAGIHWQRSDRPGRVGIRFQTETGRHRYFIPLASLSLWQWSKHFNDLRLPVETTRLWLIPKTAMPVIP